MKKVAFITVGQSPRNDMSDVWKELKNCEIIQAGVLDNLSCNKKAKRHYSSY